MGNKESFLFKYIIGPYEDELFKTNFVLLNQEEKELFYKKVLENKFSTFFFKFAEQKNLISIFDEEFLKKAEHQRQVFHIQSIKIIAEVIKINKLLKAHGINPIFLKGAAMMCNYEDFSIRSMSDLDILLPRNQLFEAYEILMNNDYKEHKKNKWTRSRKNINRLTKFSHQIPALKGTNDVLIDLHHRVTRTSDFDDCPVTNCFTKNKREINFFGEKIYVPTVNHMFLHSLLNISLNSRFQNSLRDIEDIKQLIKKSNINLEDILSDISNQKLRKGLLLVLHTLCRLSVLTDNQTTYLSKNNLAPDQELIDRAEVVALSIYRFKTYGSNELEFSAKKTFLEKITMIFSRIFISRNEIAYFYDKHDPNLFSICFVYIKNLSLKGTQFIYKKLKINLLKSDKNYTDNNSIKIEKWLNE